MVAFGNFHGLLQTLGPDGQQSCASAFKWLCNGAEGPFAFDAFANAVNGFVPASP